MPDISGSTNLAADTDTTAVGVTFEASKER